MTLQVGYNRRHAEIRVGAFLPGFHDDKNRRHVGGVGAVNQRVAAQGNPVLDTGCFIENAVDAVKNRLGAFQGGGVGQLDAGHYVTLVLDGQKARGQAGKLPAGQA